MKPLSPTSCGGRGRWCCEAAGWLGWRLGTVKDRLEQGRERLRARLTKRGVQLGTALTSLWLLDGGAGLTYAASQTIAKAAASIVIGKATFASQVPAWVAAL